MVVSDLSIFSSSSIGLEPDCFGLRLSIAEAATLQDQEEKIQRVLIFKMSFKQKEPLQK